MAGERHAMCESALTVQCHFNIVSREQFHTSCSSEENRSNSNIFLGVNNMLNNTSFEEFNYKYRRYFKETTTENWPLCRSNTYGNRVLQRRTEGRGLGGSTSPTPKFRSFDKVEPDRKLSGKCLVFLFQHPN